MAENANSQRSISSLGGEAINRRQSTRYTAVRDKIWLGWWANEEFVLVEANLINISHGGVLVASDTTPELGQPVWLRLEGGSAHESIKAVVLDTRWMVLKRRYSLRLEFPQACPPAFYQTVVCSEANGSD